MKKNSTLLALGLACSFFATIFACNTPPQLHPLSWYRNHHPCNGPIPSLKAYALVSRWLECLVEKTKNDDALIFLLRAALSPSHRIINKKAASLLQSIGFCNHNHMLTPEMAETILNCVKHTKSKKIIIVNPTLQY